MLRSRSPQNLLKRLDAIGRSLANYEDALCLLGLGSVGDEQSRLDEFSDLDFFVIVRTGSKKPFLDCIDWLSNAHSVAWSFANTPDGRKALFEDLVFCEYAIFEESELQSVAFTPGRVVWSRPGFDTTLCVPGRIAGARTPADVEWLVGEAVTNLYVGLCRYRRGEKWTAFNFVQHYAVGRLAELIELQDPQRSGGDPFAVDRRYEQRHPGIEKVLSHCLQGYEQTPASALAILGYLRERGTIPALLEQEIRRLAGEGSQLVQS